MKLTQYIIAMCAASLVLVSSRVVASNGGASAAFFQQNIFNTERHAPQSVQLVPPPVSYFKLTGTMSYGETKLAFFDSTNHKLRGSALAPADKIGGYVITEVTGDSIKLQAADKTFVTLHVGSQLADSMAHSSKDKQ